MHGSAGKDEVYKKQPGQSLDSALTSAPTHDLQTEHSSAGQGRQCLPFLCISSIEKQQQWLEDKAMHKIHGCC